MLLYEAYLLTNATVVDDAIRFVSTRSNGKLEASGKSNQDEKEESNGPDYHDEDKDQLGEEPEEEPGEIITTNEIF